MKINYDFELHTYDNQIPYIPSDELIPLEEFYATIQANDVTLFACRLYTNAIVLYVMQDGVHSIYSICAKLPNLHLIKLLWNLSDEEIKNAIRHYIGYKAQDWNEVEVYLMAKILGSSKNE